ncbi:hypothetical protein EDC34_101353 [Thermomonas haemolytica]|uniref:Sel1 repeat-containing protein n=2 Tax=Thermomonas haemolytica TaxID=141949 RepID=A0A4R3NC74_9GAMM|nr:hypothetical protein EDC34_101353 [Thermomonas haemolytica]
MHPLPKLMLLLALPAALSIPARAALPTDPTNDDMLAAAGFLDGHPDLRHRNLGLQAWERQDYATALAQFKQAAWYGDKPSQAVIGEMYWDGTGVPQDRVLGLIWMDLAAERRYDFFSKKRDYYWSQLGEDERRQALARGRAVQAEYEDAATAPRLAQALRRERNRMTGSRVGSQTSAMQVYVPGYGTIDGTQFYAPQFWDPAQYRQWQDQYWLHLRPGQVHIGDVEKVPPPPDGPPRPAPAPDTPPAARKQPATQER